MGRYHREQDAGGGHARSGGSFYHLSFRSGSRGGGACAGASYDYVTREGEYDGPDRDPATYTESGHMPSWADDDPRDYWDGADLDERANGRLYVSADFALPPELDPADQVVLASEFARELTEPKHPLYTLAVHAGRDDEGEEHNDRRGITTPSPSGGWPGKSRVALGFSRRRR